MFSIIITILFVIVIIPCILYGLGFIFSIGKWLTVILLTLIIAYIAIVVKNIIKK